MIGHLIVLTTEKDETEVECFEFLDQYLVPYHLSRQRMVSCCCVRLG